MTDTIYVALKDTIYSQKQIIDAYRDLIQSQQGTYDTFIFILLGIFAATIAINYYISTRKLRTQIEDVFKEEEPKIRKELISEITEQFKQFSEKNDKRIALIKANIARSFYNESAAESPHYAFTWALDACLNFHKADFLSVAKNFGNYAKKSLVHGKKEKSNSEFIELCCSGDFTASDLKKDIESLPKYLDDLKLEILKILYDDNNNKAGKESEENIKL